MSFHLNPGSFLGLQQRFRISGIIIAFIYMFSTLQAKPETTSIDIHGTILNEKDEPLTGVTVTIKGTKRGTQTDAKGFFSFTQVDDKATLQLTSVSYETQEVKLLGSTSLLIHLKLKIGELETVDILSTGYQSLPKERATGSFTQVDNATLNQQVGTTILPRLDGVASGVFFPKQSLQKGPAFMVRGLSTINGPKDPLIVVDNFPYDGDINNINPNDVESITILKDAAAASIWGTRAGNGVVVITTKKGRFNQPMKISFNSNITVTNKPDLGSLRIIPAADYIDLEQQLFANGFYNSFLKDRLNYPAVSPVVELLAAEQAGTISAADANARINVYKDHDSRSEFEKNIYQRGVQQQYALSISGGNEKINYYLSAGYDRGTDQLAANSRRISFSSQNTFRPFSKLQISIGAVYTQSNSLSGKPAFGTLQTGAWYLPYIDFKDDQRNPVAMARNYRQTYTDTAGGGRLLDWKYYPLTDWQHNSTNRVQQDLLANIGINYQIVGGLSADVKYLYERQTTEFSTNQDPQSYANHDLINRFTRIDPSGNIINIVPKGGIIGMSNGILESQDIRGQLNYGHSWQKHNLALIAGSEIREAHATDNGATYYGYNSNDGTTVNVDYYNTYPTYVNGIYATIPNSMNLGDQLNRYVAFFANGAYTYSGKYIVSGSARRDASNLFGVSTNNKWNPLWSGGAAWILSQESFYHSSFFPFVKLRLTYGFCGNTDPSRSGVTTLMALGPLQLTSFPSARVEQFPNPELRWEKVKTINLGIDFETATHRITGTLEGYFKKGIDLFGPALVDPTAGLNGQYTITKNVANMQGKGLELTLNTRNIEGRVSWKTDLIFNYTMNKTTNYFVDSNQRSGHFLNDGTRINPLAGKPLYSIVALRWGGLDDNGNPQGYVDGKLSQDYYTISDQTKKEDLLYRPALPVVYGSLSNTVSWRKLSLIINISYSLGYYFVKPSVSYSSLFNYGSAIGSSDYTKRWQKPGDEKTTNVPSSIYPANDYREAIYNHSETLIGKADNIRLKFINLTYDLDQILKSKALLHVQVYLNASNLGILWKANKDGIDPDAVNGVPLSRSIAFGIRANF